MWSCSDTEGIGMQYMNRAETPGKGIVVINGELTIENAGEIRNILLHALTGEEELRLDLNNVTHADLTGLQLICAAHISSIKLGKRFVVNVSDSDPLKKVVRDAGFLRHIGCSVDIGKTCIWTGGDFQWER
jgi:anti-anti-sigma regulatory factor